MGAKRSDVDKECAPICFKLRPIDSITSLEQKKTKESHFLPENSRKFAMDNVS